MLPQLLPFVSYTVFGITSTLQLKLNGLHPHPSFSSSASRLSPAATISSGLRKQLSPAFLLCRPSQGMRTRSSNLVIHVASRREFLLRCRAVGILLTHGYAIHIALPLTHVVHRRPLLRWYFKCRYCILLSKASR